MEDDRKTQRRSKSDHIVGWKIGPATVDSGIFGFSTQIVLRCDPLVALEFADAKFLGRIFDPTTTSEEIGRSIETWQKIYEHGQ